MVLRGILPKAPTNQSLLAHYSKDPFQFDQNRDSLATPSNNQKIHQISITFMVSAESSTLM